MLNLTTWAARWGVPLEALQDLKQQIGLLTPTDPAPMAGASEAAVQARVRLQASETGAKLFRNNVGVLYDAKGRPVRFGLANDSSAMNKIVKSGDLIGWEPLPITQNMVGQTVAQFVSVECKRGDWVFSGTPHERAQAAWIQLIIANGGKAFFSTGGYNFGKGVAYISGQSGEGIKND